MVSKRLPTRPKIVVEPPGPRARSIVARDRNVIMQSFKRWYPLVVERAEDYLVYDVDGNRYIDLNAGIAVLNVGSLNRHVVQAIKSQLEKFIHYSLTDFYYEEAVKLAELLLDKSPFRGRGRAFFTNSGAESIEAAIKVARYYTRRPYMIAFMGAFHGRSMGALSLTASKPVHRRGFAPLLPGVLHVPYPYPYRCPFPANSPEECGEAVIGFIEDWVFSRLVSPDEVAAIVFEPILGEGGYVVPPDNFLPLLEKLARKNGILMVVDEVQTGFCRTGRFLAVEHWGVRPDLIAVAKALAGGLPLGALIGDADVMSLPAGAHATTFGGNPVAASAAIAVIEVIEERKLCENAYKLGSMVLDRLKEAMESGEAPLIGDVRGKGLMIGIELVRDQRTKEPAVEELERILVRLFKRGYLVIGAGASTIRISPPLTIPEEALNGAVEAIIEEIRREAYKMG
ncbi:MAG: acetyl ornithine aminotransferase family protein [Hyperthermus sp.]|nr:MAG: acetyl ornithine aminotransferase family protein [Hyperthermus sp.]